MARAATHVQDMPGVESIEVMGEELVVLYDSAVTTSDIIANAFNLQGFPVEVKP